MQQSIYNRLRAIARAGETITYSELAAEQGCIPRSPVLMKQLSDISIAAWAVGEPLLSVVVVHVEDGRPGDRFFALARDLGIYGGGDQAAFFAQELKRVHDFWKDAPWAAEERDAIDIDMYQRSGLSGSTIIAK